jgi:hypothetical protein
MILEQELTTVLLSKHCQIPGEIASLETDRPPLIDMVDLALRRRI